MAAYAHPELLVEPDWLAAHLDDPNVRVIDCAVLEAYRRAHIPGAVHLPVHYYIKEDGPPGADHGTFVMPPHQFEELMGKLGVSNDTLVVPYDDNNHLVAARMWWVLKYYGHTNVKVLNGGWHRWLTEGRPATFHATRPPKASFSATPHPELVADAGYLKAKHADPACQVLDARTDAEWDGTNDRGNKRIGRVPGARHLEWLRFVETADTRRFLPADQLEKLLAEAGFTDGKETITYCQGGIRAAHAAFTMELLGWENVRVYDGSMRDWANRDDTPLTLD
ncbi:MAG: sulfurtransferase [Dehalococcoidia bacterium]|nr:sulfurtransferase [Dehalococcoidia bacterium]